MSGKAGGEGGVSLLAAVQRLVEAANVDTVYRDIYLTRAEELLAAVFSRQQHEGLKRLRRDLDQAVQQSKSAAMLQDWQRVGQLTSRAEELRRAAEQNAAAAAVAELVYDAYSVAIDPFSPGVEHLLKASAQGSVEMRDALVGTLAALMQADATSAGFFESRRAFFAALAVFSRAAAAASESAAAKRIDDVERLAFDAAQRGDIAQLGRYAQEILARQRQGGAEPNKAGESVSPAGATYQCPVDLAASFANDVVQRARALGFAGALTEPLAASAAIMEYVAARASQANLSDPETEREGTIRAAALVDEAGLPAEVSQPVKILVGQFLRTPFINSGGARYLPRFAKEAVLIEDFPETEEPPAKSELLSALGIGRRRGLSRAEIERALLRHGASIVRDRLGLEPQDFRLVCVPHDLYMRFGRDRGWGQQQQWTHFDGYHVLKGGVLRALIGGDVRYGGLSDLLSIAINDERERVIARFAVIRRARQVARWH